jgi:SAM-dependent methyltransferase
MASAHNIREPARAQADRELFDRIASHYAQKDLAASSSLARKGQLLWALGPLLDQKKDLGTILDIGCGIGAPAHYLAGHYTHYIGIDHSQEMIQAARIFHRGNPKVEFFAQDLRAVDLAGDIADLILSIGALHHMTDLPTIMQRLAVLARPGGFLLAIEPQNANPLIQLMRWLRGLIDPSYSRDQLFFSEHELEAVITNAGIPDLSIRYQGYLSTPFAQIVMQPQVLFLPLARMACRIDPWLATHLPVPLDKLSFNIIALGQFRE